MTAFSEPAGALGAELVYWREDGRRHTLLTIAGPRFAPALETSRIELAFALHASDGTFLSSWTETLKPEATRFVHSGEEAHRLPCLPFEGVLVVWISAPGASKSGRALYTRTGAMVDFIDDDAQRIASLHADQAILPEGEGEHVIELTEIVFRETASETTSLVIVNGPEPTLPSSLVLVARNHRGEEQSVVYPAALAAFSVHRIVLRDLFSELAAFCDGREATLAGRFTASRVFIRPYVMTESSAGLVSAYHGGNRYEHRSIPKILHQTFAYADAAPGVPWEIMRLAKKEMNPGYVVSRAALGTRIHLFQSHGDLEDDFFVDARIYDTAGKLLAAHERVAIAPRRGTTTLDVRTLVPGTDAFAGHLALSFSSEGHMAEYPQHLQALFEYRTPMSVARTMLWSDRWNAADRLLRQRPYRALYRVFANGPRESTLAITNPGVRPDYDREAPYLVHLVDRDGGALVYEGMLAPHATRVATIAELFPTRPPAELAIAVVESRFDLASIHLTEDRRSGAIAVEHLLAVAEVENGERILPCGA